jgi:hypothetical protein
LEGEEMKKSGFIQRAIERANLKGAVLPETAKRP